MPSPIDRKSLIKTLEDKANDNRNAAQDKSLIQLGRIHKYTDKEFVGSIIEQKWTRKQLKSTDTFLIKPINTYVPPVPEFLYSVTEQTSGSRVSFLYGGLSDATPFISNTQTSIYFYTGSCVTTIISSSLTNDYTTVDIMFYTGSITSPVILAEEQSTSSYNARFFTGSLIQVISQSYNNDTSSLYATFLTGSLFDEIESTQYNNTGSMIVGFISGVLTSI